MSLILPGVGDYTAHAISGGAIQWERGRRVYLHLTMPPRIPGCRCEQMTYCHDFATSEVYCESCGVVIDV